jgi:hypothetical protein
VHFPSCIVPFDLYCSHFLFNLWAIPPVCLDRSDLVNDLDSIDNLAESGILAIEMGGCCVHNEKLRTG